jgi:hypothetical protein
VKLANPRIRRRARELERAQAEAEPQKRITA